MTDEPSAPTRRRIPWGWVIGSLLVVLYLVFPGFLVGAWSRWAGGSPGLDQVVEMVFTPTDWIMSCSETARWFYQWQFDLITGGP